MIKKDNVNSSAAKAGLGYVVGNFILKGCVFLTLPIFSRLLSTSEFGTYNTYLAYEGLITAILGLGIYGTIKNARIKYESSFDEYVSSVLSFSLIIFIVATILANVFYFTFEGLLGYSRTIVNVLLLQSYGSALVQIYSSKLNVEFKYKSYLIISTFATLGNIALSLFLILFVFPNDRAIGRILGSALPIIAIGICLFVLSVIKGKRIFSKEFWLYSLCLGLPLVPHVISQSLLSQFDRIMITNLVGESESGIYSFVYTISTILVILCSSIDSAWTPWVYMKIHHKERIEVKKKSPVYVLFFAFLTLGFICVSPEIVKLFGDESYWSGIDLLIPLSLGHYFLFLYFLPVNMEYYHNKTLFISIGTVGAALLNLALNLFFISAFGYKAAAYTTLFSHMVLFVAHCIIAKKYSFFDTYRFKEIVFISVILVTLSFTILLTEQYSILSLIIRYSFVASIIVSALIGFHIFIKNHIFSTFRKTYYTES